MDFVEGQEYTLFRFLADGTMEERFLFYRGTLNNGDHLFSNEREVCIITANDTGSDRGWCLSPGRAYQVEADSLRDRVEHAREMLRDRVTSYQYFLDHAPVEEKR